MRRFRPAVCLAVLMTLAACACAQEPLVQPTKIPGKWDMKTAQPLPPIVQAAKRAVPGNLVYGLYTWAGEYLANRQSIRKVGWRSIRLAGPFDDAIMKAVAEDGVDVMVTCGLRVQGGQAKKRPDYPSDEAFLADYVKGLDTFLTRYGPGGTFFKDNPGVPNRPIMSVELWNEPNFQYMIPPDERPRAEVEADREKLYAKVLTAAYPAIKKKWPTVNVVGFAAGGASAGDLRFIKNVHDADPAVAKCYDILSTHPYVPPVPPETNSIRGWGSYSVARSLDAIRKTLARHGNADARIWYTEMGWPISKADGGHFDTAADGVYVTPALQAAYVVRAYALALRLGVERVNIMFVTDSDGFNGGFFLRDKSWRPSAHAVRTMIRMMPNPKLSETVSDGEDGYYAYAFMAVADGGKKVANMRLMVWNVAGPRTVEIESPPGGCVLTDMLGHTKKVAPEEGELSIDIGPCPVYLTPVP